MDDNKKKDDATIVVKDCYTFMAAIYLLFTRHNKEIISSVLSCILRPYHLFFIEFEKYLNNNPVLASKSDDVVSFLKNIEIAQMYDYVSNGLLQNYQGILSFASITKEHTYLDSICGYNSGYMYGKDLHVPNDWEARKYDNGGIYQLIEVSPIDLAGRISRECVYLFENIRDSRDMILNSEKGLSILISEMIPDTNQMKELIRNDFIQYVCQKDKEIETKVKRKANTYRETGKKLTTESYARVFEDFRESLKQQDYTIKGNDYTANYFELNFRWISDQLDDELSLPDNAETVEAIIFAIKSAIVVGDEKVIGTYDLCAVKLKELWCLLHTLNLIKCGMFPELKQHYDAWLDKKQPMEATNEEIVDSIEIPKVLQTEKAAEILQICKKEKWLDENWQTTLSGWKKVLLADVIAEKLGIRAKWKLFEELWNTKHMKQTKSHAIRNEGYSDFIHTLDKKLKRHSSV